MKCTTCDHELAVDTFLVEHPEDCEHCKSLCWSPYNIECSYPAVDWRARALAAEAHAKNLGDIMERCAEDSTSMLSAAVQRSVELESERDAYRALVREVLTQAMRSLLKDAQ